MDPRTLDLLGMGSGIDVCEQRMQPDPEDDTNPVGVNRVKSVKGMSLKVFQHKLVNHFKILFARNEIKWPTRRPINQMATNMKINIQFKCKPTNHLLLVSKLVTKLS